MAGSPKKRARRLAMEAAKAEAAKAARTPHTIPTAREPLGWVEPEPVLVPPSPPKMERPQTDPIIDSILPGASVEENPDILAAKDKAFNELIGLALDRALDIMRLSPHHVCVACGHEQGNEQFDSKIMARQASIIASVLSTTARIDEARLRGKGRNKVNELLEELRKMKPGMN